MSSAAARPLEYYYTMDDINNLPEGKRAELIDGELYMMAAPGLMQVCFITVPRYGVLIMQTQLKGL